MVSDEHQGVKYTSVSVVISSILQISIIIFFAKVASLEIIGIISFFALTYTLLEAISDVGFSGGIIQRKDITDELINSLFGVSFIISVLFVLVIFSLFVGLNHFLFIEDVIYACLFFTAITLCINQIGGVPLSLLKKSLKFKEVLYCDIVNTCAVVISLVLMYFYYELDPITVFCASKVIGYFCKNIFTCILAIKINVFIFLPRHLFWRSELKWFYKFGIAQVGSILLNNLVRFSDQIIIAFFINLEALGLYKVISDIISLPGGKFNSIFNNVYFPLLSKLFHKSKKEFSQKFCNLLKLTSFISYPLVLGMLGISKLFPMTILDEKFLNTGFLFFMLTIVAVVSAKGNPLGVLLYASGRVNFAFVWNLSVYIVQAIALVISVSLWGMSGFLMVLILSQLVQVLISYDLIIVKDISINRFSYYKITLISLCNALVMCFIVYLFNDCFIKYVNAWVLLGVSILIGIGIYYVLSRIFNASNLNEAMRVFTGRKN